MSLVTRAVSLMAFLTLVVAIDSATAQQSVSDVLSFLVTNRSIATDDFVRDAEAAAATRDTISALLLSELATLPINASAGGFTHHLSPTLGTIVRSSPSFGPFFTERSLTGGQDQSSFSVNYQVASFDTLDGRGLRDGTLVSTASRIEGDPQPFDIETVTLNIRTDTVIVAANYGVTDRLDISAAIPWVRLTLTGHRTDTYRGHASLQATGAAAASGIGDVLVRVKYGLIRRDASGVAVGGEARLPTGDPMNLLGTGEVAVKPRIIGSYETQRMGVHADVGYSVGGLSREVTFAGAMTMAAAPTVTLIAELAGRRMGAFRRLSEETNPHPRLVGIETVRLTGKPQETTRAVAIAGVKWNISGTWLINANVMRPLTSAGLNAPWVPTVTVDYSMGP